jgi:hypothetical protein
VADFQLNKQGTYLVRAVDPAGNEDDNQITHSFDLSCPGQVEELDGLTPEPEEYDVGQNPRS